jgi:uncharacterized cupin superfamily protein
MISPLHPSTVEHRQLTSARTGEAFSRSAVLSELLGLRNLFIHHDVIAPGHRASGTHFHTVREEVVYVVRGRLRACIGEREFDIQAGELVAFHPGEMHAHHVTNVGSEDAEILVFATNEPNDCVHSTMNAI